MGRSSIGRHAEEAIALMEAEDGAIRLLATLPRQVAAVAAVKAAVELAGIWESEKDEMLRRNDPTPVYLSTEEERLWLYSAARKYCVDPLWQCCPAVEVRDHLAGLSPDAAAFTAYKVARWVCRGEDIIE
jgi:hypothetical protein